MNPWTKYVSTRKDVTVTVHVPARNKYGAVPTTVDGIRFDSKREAARYLELKLLQRADKIAHLEVHPSFPLQVVALYKPGPPWVFEHVGVYSADFRYVDLKSGEVIIEDLKSRPTRTTDYKLRKRLVEAIHGITVTEVE
jgi:Protein of unknown function (DUF1064)